MKSLKNGSFLFLIWIVSLLALCFSFMLYAEKNKDPGDIFAGTFLLMIYSFVFSLPAFIFFFLVSFFTLKSEKLSRAQKKLIMISANLLDILATFGAFYLLMLNNSLDNSIKTPLSRLVDVFAFYPVWVLTGVSTLLIIVLPFDFNKKTLIVQL